MREFESIAVSFLILLESTIAGLMGYIIENDIETAGAFFFSVLIPLVIVMFICLEFGEENERKFY